MMDRRNSEHFQLEYKKGNTAFLLGNGINNLITNYRWDSLLLQIYPQIKLTEKPYPLAFEEIVLSKLLDANNEESYAEILKSVKDQIAEHCSKISLNDTHKKLAKINATTFLTTNYDYAIEKSLDGDFNRQSLHNATWTCNIISDR